MRSTSISQRGNRFPELADPIAFLLIDAGLSDYEAVYETQLDFVEKKKLNAIAYDYLIFVEHPEVYTYGRKSRVHVNIESVPTYSVERGGEVTYHNPGQLVAYPILTLREGERDLHLHLRRLEGVLIHVLRDFGLLGERREGATGVWLRGKDKKIASIGVAVSSWVTYHGCALNVENDLRGFSKINPCGYSSEVMTSMKEELGSHCPSMEEVKESFLLHFMTVFERSLIL